MDLSIVHLRARITREPDDEAEAMIQQWPLRGGTRFFFTYFPLEIDMKKAKRILQTLAFIGTMTREPRVLSPLQLSRVLDVFCTGQYADLFDTEEQVGFGSGVLRTAQIYAFSVPGTGPRLCGR